MGREFKASPWEILMMALAMLLTVDLGTRLALELFGAINTDTALYYAVAQGMHNGLEPYHDLFETKPPGIFIVTYLSLLFTGGTLLGGWLHGILLLVVPYLVYRLYTNLVPSNRSRALDLSVVCLGMYWAIFSHERSGGGLQVEPFGTAFTLAYAVVITSQIKKSRYQIGLASIALLGAIGFKEPFLLIALACALLLFPSSPRRIFTLFVLPAILACLLGTVVMLLLGYLDHYINIYLAQMLGKHIHVHGPLFGRLLNWPEIIGDLNDFSLLLGYAVLVLLLLITSCYLPKKNSAHSWLSLCSLVAAVALTVLTVGIGGHYYNHHYIFAVPVYVVATLIVLSYAARCSAKHYKIAVHAFALALLLVTMGMPNRTFQSHRSETLIRSQDALLHAKYIDEILEDCGHERYLFIGNNGIDPYAYTKHSPLGPLFIQFEQWFTPDQTMFRESFLNNLSSAQLVVFKQYHIKDLAAEAEQYLQDNFVKEPWPCSKTSPPPASHYTLLFRSEVSKSKSPNKNSPL